MKIAFVTSCLEPGEDGVGDYTSLLAAECGRRGHETRLVALNDAHVNSAVINGTALRLSARLPWSYREEQAREFLSTFAPDRVSLQFVCYGYHSRGIDFALGTRLRKITAGRPVEMMFHELWIGAEQGARLKHRLIGAMQRAAVLKIVRSLDARTIHTSNPAYAELLGRAGVHASLLPLFGAIPLPSKELAPRRTGDTLVFGLFGALHPAWPAEPLFSLLRSTGKRIVIAHVGRIGSGAPLWKRLEREYAGAVEFRMLGQQPAERIAAFFQTEVDFGIATTPWELVGKSATVAAMLEHGLPVIVNRDDVHYAGWHQEGYSSQLIKMDTELPKKLSVARRECFRSRLPEVADQFLSAMEKIVS